MRIVITNIVGSAFILAACFCENSFAKSVTAWAPFDSPLYDTDVFSAAGEHVVTVENLRVHYVESGTGRTVVLIHGNAGDVEDFEFGTIDRLSRDYRVLAIDRPGHGGSDRPVGKEATVEYQAELLHETLVSLGITQPVLVGHSWGGSLALCYALKYPGELSGMVLLAPAAYPDGRGHALLRTVTKTPVIGKLSILIGKAFFGRGMLKQDLDQAFYPQSVPEDYLKHVTASWLGEKQLEAYLDDKLVLNDCLKDIKDRYSQIKIPVVIVTGDKDKIVSPKDNAYRLRKAIPRSRLIELKNTGHEIPETRPESIHAAIRLIPGPSNGAARFVQ